MSSFKDQTLTAIVQNVLHSLISFVDCQHFTWGYVNIHNHQQVKGVSHVCLYRCQWSVVKGIRCCFEKILKHHPFQRRELLWTAELSRRFKRKEHDGPPPCSGGWGEVTGDHLAFQSGSSPTHPRTHIRSRYSRGTHTVGDYIPRPLGICVVSRDSLVMGAGMSELWWVIRAKNIIGKRMDFFLKKCIRGSEIAKLWQAF